MSTTIELKDKKSRIRFQKLFDKMLDAWEKDYRAEKARVMQDLHNDLVEVIARHINENGATVEQICFVLDTIKYELTVEKLKQIYETGDIEKTLRKPTEISLPPAEKT